MTTYELGKPIGLALRGRVRGFWLTGHLIGFDLYNNLRKTFYAGLSTGLGDVLHKNFK